jgi:signal transduction histidine kinase
MTRRVVPLIAAHSVLATAMVLLGRADAAGLGSPARVLALAAAFALVGLMPMHLELGRSACTLTLVEAILVLALFALGPIGVVVAAAAGESIACLTHRQSLLKVAYNASATALGAIVAALAFAAMAGPHPHGTEAWLAAIAAVACFALCCHASTSLVLSVVGEGGFERVFLSSANMAAAASTISATVGLALYVLSGQGLWAPFLLAPIIAVVGLETRRATAHQADRLRFERLVTASGRTTGLQGFPSALAQNATEARTLVTGSSAACCAPDRDGVWRGRLVDDQGVHAAPAAMVDGVIALVETWSGREIPVDRLAPARRTGLPSGATVVVAGNTSAPTSASGAIALAVFRDIGGDDQGDARAQALLAFAFHAALTTTNAVLFERVEDALRQQVDVNRQKEEFLAAVSHELRTPLASMLGSVETVRRLGGRLDDHARERFLAIARRQGQRLQRLIEELLLSAALARGHEPVVVEEVDLRRLLGDVVHGLAEQETGRIVVRVDDDARMIHTDSAKLRQVVANLVENATKYAPTGPIEVRAACGTIGEAERVLIRVVDHGPGIPPRDRARAFEHFVQLDGSSTRARGGTGLGLYLCAQVTELLDANLRLGDTPGGGATFALSLPVALGAGQHDDPVGVSRP